jgi:hypothetical protein
LNRYTDRAGMLLRLVHFFDTASAAIAAVVVCRATRANVCLERKVATKNYCAFRALFRVRPSGGGGGGRGHFDYSLSNEISTKRRKRLLMKKTREEKRDGKRRKRDTRCCMAAVKREDVLLFVFLFCLSSCI